MPRDLFILGCGRSGTSMVAGLFRSAGYFQGSSFYQPRHSNPRGFFEDREVNDINETLLLAVLPARRLEGGVEYLADSPTHGQRWLSRIPVADVIPSAPVERERIARVVAHRPFCLKDPRFCYTLSHWRSHTPQARMICVFRRPQVVVASILKEMSTTPYLESLPLSVKQAFEVWRLMYSHVLRRHALTGDWLFVEYGDVFRAPGLDRLAEFAEAPIDAAFPERELDRSTAVSASDRAAEDLYEELVERSRRR